jgi:kynurenine formamidase
VERQLPTSDEIGAYLKDKSNWGRWGKDDDLGTINLITAEKRLAAAKLVKSGRTVSLSRPWNKEPGIGNPKPALQGMRKMTLGAGGAAGDFIGIDYHGNATTHIDALCHFWGAAGIYNGRSAEDVLGFDGATFGAIDRWSGGIVTRGVLLDIPKLRGEPYVDADNPVHGWDLEDAAKAQGVSVEPGDALVVYMGREAWQAANPESPYHANPEETSPGLHGSAVSFLRENDVAVLVWDFLDARPSGFGDFRVGLAVHMCIPAFGLALLDNALLEPLATACAEEGRYEFMLTIAPLNVPGGTGSPANPIALL